MLLEPILEQSRTPWTLDTQLLFVNQLLEAGLQRPISLGLINVQHPATGQGPGSPSPFAFRPGETYLKVVMWYADCLRSLGGAVIWGMRQGTGGWKPYSWS